MEEWRAIGSIGYEISNEGRIRNSRTGKIRKLMDNRTYLHITITKNRKERYSFDIHVLVAETFIGPKPPGHEVNHKDGNKRNNKHTNLEWVTHSKNMKHAYATKLSPTKLNPIQVQEIRVSDMSQRKLAKKYGVNRTTIKLIQSRRIWN